MCGSARPHPTASRRCSTISNVPEARRIFASRPRSSAANGGWRRHKDMQMNEKPSRLGRGLAALIGDMTPIEGARLAETGSGKRLPVEFIIANRANPRRDFDPDQLEELTSSIREKGVMQPLLVRPTEDPNIFE